MEKAIAEARSSGALSQYIAAVVVGPSGEVLAIEHTATIANNDATAHAELSAIRSACKKLNNRYLPGCWLYSTLEPCPMCTAGAIWAKCAGIVFGATQKDAEDFSKSFQGPVSWRQISIPAREIVERGDPRIGLVEGFMRDECRSLFELSKEH